MAVTHVVTLPGLGTRHSALGTATMSQGERTGRILLAAAVGLLFLVVFASMVTGRPLWPLIVGVALIGLVGGVLMVLSRRP